MALATEIVAAYVQGNSVASQDLPALIRGVNAALGGVQDPAKSTPAVDLVPAVPIKKSITPDFIVCLEDGKKFKSLRRHLMTKFGLTPEAYRQKWSLPSDYPMVAPNYAQARSKLAKDMGLGKKKPPITKAVRKRKKTDDEKKGDE
jgi:predicted transcriptional regulator